MAKTEHNLRKAEDFVRDTLSRNFGQVVTPETLRAAAERLCEALPERECEPA